MPEYEKGSTREYLSQGLPAAALQASPPSADGAEAQNGQVFLHESVQTQVSEL
jgi:hypothetical protein